MLRRSREAVVLLLFQRLTLDFELHGAAQDFVELGGHGVDFGAQFGGGFVHQIDGLVGQEAVGDVAIGENRGAHQSGVFDAHAVVQFVTILQAAQNGNGVFHGRLIHHDGLEAAFQRGILLDVLSVFVERGSADAVQLAARQHGLQQIAGVHGAFGLARADYGVQFVDEKDDLAVRIRGLL